MCNRTCNGLFVVPVVDTQWIARRSLERRSQSYSGNALRLFHLRENYNLPSVQAQSWHMISLAVEVNTDTLDFETPSNREKQRLREQVLRRGTHRLLDIFARGEGLESCGDLPEGVQATLRRVRLRQCALGRSSQTRTRSGGIDRRIRMVRRSLAALRQSR